MYLENLEGKDGTWCIRFFDICGFRFIFDQVATKHQCLRATFQQQFFKGNVAKAPTWCCSWVSRTLITCWSLSDRSNIRNEPRIFQGTASFIVRIFTSLPTPVVLANPVNPLQTLSRKHHVSTFSFLEGKSSNISNICCFMTNLHPSFDLLTPPPTIRSSFLCGQSPWRHLILWLPPTRR